MNTSDTATLPMKTLSETPIYTAKTLRRMTSRPAASSRVVWKPAQRSSGLVSFLALSHTVSGVILIFLGLSLIGTHTAGAVFALGIGALELAIGLGLHSLSRMAWRAAGILSVIEILAVFSGGSGLFMPILTVVILLNRETLQAFGIRHHGCFLFPRTGFVPSR